MRNYQLHIYNHIEKAGELSVLLPFYVVLLNRILFNYTPNRSFQMGLQVI